MKCINYADTYTEIYNVGDTMVLRKKERFTYMGTQYDELNRRTVHLYEPVNGKSKEYPQTSADTAKRFGIPDNFIVFLFKVPVKASSINNPEAPERKRSFTSKMFGWFLESNRWKHFLYAIPAGGDKLLARYRTSSRNGIQRRAARREIRLGGCHVHGGRRICRGGVVLAAIGRLRIALPY